MVNNSRIGEECRCCLDLLSGRFTVSLIRVSGHSNREIAEPTSSLRLVNSFRNSLDLHRRNPFMVSWILINGAAFTRISIFSDSQAVIRSLSSIVNNSRIGGECRCCVDLLSGRFSVSLIRLSGHSNREIAEPTSSLRLVNSLRNSLGLHR